MAIHPGEKVLRRVRRKQLTDLFAGARRDANRRVSETDLWGGYALAMGRKLGIIPADVDASCVMRGTLATFYARHENRWNQRIQGEKIGEWQIPDRVWSFQPLCAEYEAAE